MGYSRLLSVLTPAADRSLVALAVVKDELGITDAATDTRLTRWIREASATIEGEIGRPLRAEIVQETFRAHHRNHHNDWPCADWSYRLNPPTGASLLLVRYPIVAIDSIVEDGSTLDADTDYEIDDRAGILYRLSGTVRIPWYGQTIVVRYTGGWDTLDAVEPDMQTACLYLLRHRLVNTQRDPLLRTVSIPGVIEQQYWLGAPGDRAGLPDDVERLISRYRDARL
jgi:hypothetical protein